MSLSLFSSNDLFFVAKMVLEPATFCVRDQDDPKTRVRENLLGLTQIHASVIHQIPWIHWKFGSNKGKFQGKHSHPGFRWGKGSRQYSEQILQEGTKNNKQSTFSLYSAKFCWFLASNNTKRQTEEAIFLVQVWQESQEAHHIRDTQAISWGGGHWLLGPISFWNTLKNTMKLSKSWFIVGLPWRL